MKGVAMMGRGHAPHYPVEARLYEPGA